MDWEAYYRRNREDEERGAAVYTEVTDPVVLAVLDVLAPHTRFDADGDRSPIFEFGHETSPTRMEMVELAVQIVDAVRGACAQR